MTCEARFEVIEVQSSVNDLLREKYSRQILFAGLGEQGQERLVASSAVVVGCGAIGAAAANLLVRAGVGRIRIIDRDFVEPSNLQRQTLFDEADARDALPKAVAAERKLRSINSSVSVEGIVADVNPRNVGELLAGFDVILDGTDNFETRFLVNEFAVKSSQTWIYAAAVASYGVTMTIRPGLTPASRACSPPIAAARVSRIPATPSACLAPSSISSPRSRPPKPSSSSPAARPTCTRASSLAMCGPAISNPFVSRAILNVPSASTTNLPTSMAPLNRISPCAAAIPSRSTSAAAFSTLATLKTRLASTVDDVRQNDFLLRFRIDPYEMTVFTDGRAILKGTKDPAVARSLYARYIGT